MSEHTYASIGTVAQNDTLGVQTVKTDQQGDDVLIQLRGTWAGATAQIKVALDGGTPTSIGANGQATADGVINLGRLNPATTWDVAVTGGDGTTAIEVVA